MKDNMFGKAFYNEKILGICLYTNVLAEETLVFSGEKYRMWNPVYNTKRTYIRIEQYEGQYNSEKINEG